MSEPKPTQDTLDRRHSRESSISSASTTSLVFDRLAEESEKNHDASSRPHPSAARHAYTDDNSDAIKESDINDPETGPFLGASSETTPARKGVDRKLKKVLLIVGGFFVAAWI
ncbi:hypothetical protein BN1708_018061, partial [Verticillium longisporum]